MKKTSAFSPTRVSMAVAVVCVGISMPSLAQMNAKMTGRVHFDARAIDSGLDQINDRDTASAASNFELRRARIGFSGDYNKQIQFEGVANAVGSTTNIIDTAFINYGYNSAANIRVGRFKQPFSLEENTSSNNIDFMERSYVNQITPGKKLGAMLHGANDLGFTYAASIYQNDFNEVSNSDGASTMGAFRITTDLAKLGKMGDGKYVAHLGYGLDRGTYEVNATSSGNTSKTAEVTTRATILSFRDENRGLSNVYRLQKVGVSTGGIASYGAISTEAVDVTKATDAFEAALAYGPFKFQAEYADSKFSASTVRSGDVALNANVKTNYVAFVYNITGEDFAKSYSKGAFGGIKPTSEFMKDYGGVVGNGTGAWQVGYRYSTYEVALNEAAAQSSTGTGYTVTADSGSRYQNSPKATTQTFSLNWILNSNARVMFNYSTTNFGSDVEALDTDYNSSVTSKEDIISVRTQFNF
jgi:phosphate-selective porin OprO/OprP